jgi:hypothetical protein
MSWLSKNPGNLDLLEPQGTVQVCNGIVLPLPYIQLRLQGVSVPFRIFCYIFYTYVFITFSLRATCLAILFLTQFYHSILRTPHLRVIYVTAIFVQCSFTSHSWVPYTFSSTICYTHKDKCSMDIASSFSKTSHPSLLKKSLTQLRFGLKNAVFLLITYLKINHFHQKLLFMASWGRRVGNRLPRKRARHTDPSC